MIVIATDRVLVTQTTFTISIAQPTMPARLYLRAQPRAFFLLTDTHALVFRQPGAEESKASRSVVVAEFLPLDEVDRSGLLPVGMSTVEGVLGVTSVPSGSSTCMQADTRSLTCARSLPAPAYLLDCALPINPRLDITPISSGVSRVPLPLLLVLGSTKPRPITRYIRPNRFGR